MTPTLTKREQACVALCRQNHSGQVRDLLDIIDRLTAAKVGIEIPETTGCKIEDNFFCPAEWTEVVKTAYTEWLARMPEDHPSKMDPRPWERNP